MCSIYSILSKLQYNTLEQKDWGVGSNLFLSQQCIVTLCNNLLCKSVQVWLML